MEAAKLYVGNLSYSTTDEQLRELFSKAGNVKSATVIMDRETGRSKGFGFVEMDNSAEAQKAITMFHGAQFQDRALTVNIARPREERPRDDRSRGGSGGSGGYDNRRGSGGNRSRDKDDRRRTY
jgi:RNA recognition motif-containing protein